MADTVDTHKAAGSAHDEHADPVPEKGLGHVAADDETAAYTTGAPASIDKATNRRLFWQINRRILVGMLGTYFCQSLDKGTLGFSSIMGIQEDAGLDGDKYNWLGTILYLGILVGEYPTNFLLQKLPIAKYLAGNVFLWGVVIMCSAAATNFPGLMAVRFLLGVFESCVQPTFIIMTAMWFTREEQTVLTSLWYSMTGVQLMIGGILAWGTSHYIGHAIRSWQLLFLVLGAATCTWGVFLGWYIPDSPMKAKCFSEEDKRLMVERVRANDTGIQNKTFKKYQMLEALMDPIVWLYVLLQLSSTLIIGGLGVFSNIIIKSFGFTTLQTQLLNIAQGGVTIAVMVGGAALATWSRRTVVIMHLWTFPAIAGTAVIYSISPSPATRVGLLVAFYCTQFVLAEGNLLFSLISRNVAGQTKKSTVLAMTFIAWAAGNATAPQIFQSTDAPRYAKGFTAHFCLYGLFNVLLFALRMMYIWRNREKTGASTPELASGLESQVNQTRVHANAFLDLTDRENDELKPSGMEVQ
ncbi:putative MFS transporter [Aspergillus mulundensis]|uniref:Putative Permease of the major facilitator superfamily n=1 Tax=Aspergillus mulundensis TaxID=1810919 RepID=A0A3D8RE45_9EURO|nr:putative Permease of the major facilitator superfamily [Aspergillus mulundensis]RDW72337.1 putative Permease of the major facilitator superfamily [Aspergillus mulundensis]